MFDTVSLTHALKPRLTERGLTDIGATHPKGRTQWAINPRKSETFPSLTFQTQPNGVQYLTARQSLPRLRHGHNAILPKSQLDIYAELGLMADAIYQRTGIEFDPLTANVTGVHCTRDLSIGRELIAPTLMRLEPRQLPRYTRLRLDHGIEYKQIGASILIYSKHHEIHKQVMASTIPLEHQHDALQAADGVLRVECKLTLPSLDRLQGRAGSTRKAKDVLTPELSNFVIDTFLEKLQFDAAINSAQSNKSLDQLIEVYGSRVAARLYGFLTLAREYGKDFWKIESLDYPRKTYFTNLRLCRNAGVWDA